MLTRIETRTLGISMLPPGMAAGQEGIQYRLGDKPWDEVSPPSLNRVFRWETVKRLIGGVQDCVGDLIGKAVYGEPRGRLDLEDAINRLSALVLPDMGLAEIMAVTTMSPRGCSAPLPAGYSTRFLEPGIHPQLDIEQSDIAAIPWEALRERFAYCENRACLMYRRPFPCTTAPLHGTLSCQHCRKALRRLEGRLSATWRIAHLVHSDKVTMPPEGNEFLIVADPTEDLCDSAHDSDGRCVRHLTDIGWMLKGCGYQVKYLTGEAATTANVLDAIHRPTMVGVYYFGHGSIEGGSNEACLVLARNGKLYPNDIEGDAGGEAPRLRFVFLNACHAGGMGNDWGFRKPIRSMAHAFARHGKGKVVIAPIWPVINVQAAETGLHFFQKAVRGGRLSLALNCARRHSYRAYQAGEPEISWAAYRYFGDPDRTLPAQTEAKPHPTAAKQDVAPARIFNRRNELRTDLFSCSIEEILLRAAKRRNVQHRARASCLDLLAGLIRRGELTRLALRHCGAEPDLLYDQLGQSSEEETPGVPLDSEWSPADADRWDLLRREEFDGQAIDVLARAYDRACGRDGNRLIFEMDLLESFLEDDAWTDDAHASLPRADLVRDFIRSDACRGQYDENGCLRLDDLTPVTRRIVEKSHALAQQRGECPIPSRLLFAAFLDDEQGYTAELCRKQNVPADLLKDLMIAATGCDLPDSFPLGWEACSRVIQRTLDRAKELTGPNQKITERTLLHAFCDAAPEDFKVLLKSLPHPFGLDLDVFAGRSPAVLPHSEKTDPQHAELSKELEKWLSKGNPSDENSASADDPIASDQFDHGALQLLNMASLWARVQGSPSIRVPHLFAALVGGGLGEMGAVLRQAGLDPEQVKVVALSMVPPQLATEIHATPTVSESVFGILTAAIQQRRSEGRDEATQEHIFRAFISTGGGVVGKHLRESSPSLDRWWTQRTRTHGDEGQNPPRDWYPRPSNN